MTASVLPLTLTLTLCALASFPFSNAKPSYAPKTDQACPDNLLRQPSGSNHTLNPNEVQYLADRRELFPDAWRDWVGDGTRLGYDLDKLKMTAYDPSGLPVIGIAISGGGWRSVSVSVRGLARRLTGSIAAQHRSALGYFLLLMRAIRLPKRRAQVDSSRCPVT